MEVLVVSLVSLKVLITYATAAGYSASVLEPDKLLKQLLKTCYTCSLFQVHGHWNYHTLLYLLHIILPIYLCGSLPVFY